MRARNRGGGVKKKLSDGSFTLAVQAAGLAESLGFSSTEELLAASSALPATVKTVTTTTSNTSSTSNTTTTSTSSSSSGGGLSDGAKIGLGIGLGVGIPVLLLVLYTLRRSFSSPTKGSTPQLSSSVVIRSA